VVAAAAVAAAVVVAAVVAVVAVAAGVAVAALSGPSRRTSFHHQTEPYRL
jgi:hypothetical protein